MRASVVRIEFDGAPETRVRFGEHLAISFVPTHQLAAFQEEIVSIHVLGAAAGDQGLLALAKLNLQRSDDLLREFVLHREYVGEIAIETVRPNVRTVGSVDKLAGNAPAIAGLAHASFQHVAHAELAADLLHIDGLTLIGKTRVSRDDI